MPHHVHHIAYLTDDLAAAKQFYQRVFDAEVFLETKNAETGSKLAFLRFGDTEVELIEPADRERLQGRTGLVLDHVGYLVDNLDATIEILASRGVEFASTTPRIGPDGSRLMQVAPTTALGTRLHLSERSSG